MSPEKPAKKRRRNLVDELSSQSASFDGNSTDSSIVDRESELGAEGRHLLKRDLHTNWNSLDPLDKRLYTMQSGLPDCAILPLSWRAVADKLVRQGWFTRPQFREWGNEGALRARYNRLREHIQGDAAAKEPKTRQGWKVKWAEDFDVFLLKPGEVYRETRNLPHIAKATEQNMLVFAQDTEDLEDDTIVVDEGEPSSPTVGDRSSASGSDRQDESSAEEESPVKATNQESPLMISSGEDSSSEENSSDDDASDLADVLQASTSYARRRGPEGEEERPALPTMTRKRQVICSDTGDEPSDEGDERAADATLDRLLDDISAQDKHEGPDEDPELPAVATITETPPLRDSAQDGVAKAPACSSDSPRRLPASEALTPGTSFPQHARHQTITRAPTAPMTPPQTVLVPTPNNATASKRATSKGAEFQIHTDEREPSQGRPSLGSAIPRTSQDDKENVENHGEEEEGPSQDGLPEMSNEDEHELVRVAQAASDDLVLEMQ